jgi:hypothetical protein
MISTISSQFDDCGNAPCWAAAYAICRAAEESGLPSRVTSIDFPAAHDVLIIDLDRRYRRPIMPSLLFPGAFGVTSLKESLVTTSR